MKARIQSVFVWIFAVISLIVIFPVSGLVWILTVPFDKRRTVFHFFVNLWGSFYTWVIPFWSVTIENRDKIRKKQVYVLVSNHQSLLDILVLSRLFAHFRWVSKEENFKVPILGWVMVMNGDVRLKREKRSSIIQMMRDGIRTLKNGSSLMIFPEGTRSETTEMRNFKEGAFRLAKETGTPILPIVMDGTGNALPKHGYIIRGHHRIRIRILDEISADIVRQKSAKELKDETFRMMSEALKEIRKEKS